MKFWCRPGGRGDSTRGRGGAWCPGWEEVFQCNCLIPHFKRDHVHEELESPCWFLLWRFAVEGNGSCPLAPNTQRLDPHSIFIEMDSTTWVHLYEQLGYSCVPSSQCDQGVIVTDGRGILQVNLTFFKLVGFFKNQMSTSHKFKIAGKKARGDKCTGKEQLPRQSFFSRVNFDHIPLATFPNFCYYPLIWFLFDQGWNEVCCLSLPAELFKF